MARHALDAPQALVFDLDGLLVATEDACFETMRALVRRHGAGAEVAPDEFAEFIGMPLERTWRTLRTRYGMSAEVHELVAERNERLLRWYEEPELLPGAQEIVLWAHGSGLPLAIATGSPTALAGAAAASLPFGHCFSAVVAADHERVAAPKPAPDTYLAACEVLGVPPAQATAIEDSPLGASAALAAGIPTVVVPNDWTRAAAFPDGVVVRDSLGDVLAALSS